MLVVFAACGVTDRAEYVARDPCAPLALTAAAATAAELDGIAGAVALWRDRGVSAFDAAPAEAPAIEIGSTAPPRHFTASTTPTTRACRSTATSPTPQR